MTINRPETDILVIEDDDQIAYLLEFMLTREGFTVQFANDGLVAQSMIKEMAPPRLVVLDIMLPYIDGFELIKQIHSSPDWKTVPVIMLSSKSQEADIVHALKNGASDYIIKPFNPMELIARIQRYL